MDTHVKVLGSLQIALGAMVLFGALVLVFVFGGVTTAMSASGDPDARVALPIVGVYGLWVLFSKDTERLFTPSTHVV